MKTLINKHNPSIRITAPEIEEITSLGYTSYEIKQEGTFSLLFSPDIWTLVEEEPMDLEEEIEKWITPSNPSIDPKKGTISREVYIDCIIVTARHFYELGRKEDSK